MKMRGILSVSIVMLAIAGFLSAGLAQPATELPKQASIATHRVGGSFHVIGVGIAKVVSGHTPIKVVVKPNPGPTTYMQMVNTGEIEMGVPNALDMYFAFAGNRKIGYEKRMNHVRMLLPGGKHFGMVPIAVRKDSDIKTVSDLKGKKVTGKFSAAKIVALEVEAHLALGGLTWDDVVVIPVPDYKSSLRALREGRVDACFPGSYSSAATMELAEAVGLRMLPLKAEKPEYLKRFKELLPGFEIIEIQPTMWLKEPTTVTAFRVNLVSYEGVSEYAGYVIVKTLYENYKELITLGKPLKSWKADIFFEPEPTIPYHPGTIKYYKEKGLWTQDVEKLQKELLAKAK